MSLERQEATSSNRKHVIGLSVLCCDAEGCGEELCFGPGEGDSLGTDDLETIAAEGWVSNRHDYCPNHAHLVESDESDDE